MMYRNKFVASVKCHGKILREDGDTVYIPFGSEYSLIFKNLNTRRAVVDVTIDGRRAINGLIVEPNGTTELERFVDDDKKGHRFKFIEKTEQISDYRGDEPDDGLVRVEFRFEKQRIHRSSIVEIWDYPIYIHRRRSWDYYPCWPLPHIIFGGTGDGVQRSETRTIGDSMSGTKYSCSNNTGPTMSAEQKTVDMPEQKSQDAGEGITVDGLISEQEFGQGWTDELEENSEVIILRLRGKAGEKIIEKPVTVKTKTECKTCGSKHKSGTKFCSSCGTSLEIV